MTSSSRLRPIQSLAHIGQDRGTRRSIRPSGCAHIARHHAHESVWSSGPHGSFVFARVRSHASPTKRTPRTQPPSRISKRTSRSWSAQQNGIDTRQLALPPSPHHHKSPQTSNVKRRTSNVCRPRFPSRHNHKSLFSYPIRSPLGWTRVVGMMGSVLTWHGWRGRQNYVGKPFSHVPTHEFVDEFEREHHGEVAAHVWVHATCHPVIRLTLNCCHVSICGCVPLPLQSCGRTSSAASMR